MSLDTRWERFSRNRGRGRRGESVVFLLSRLGTLLHVGVPLIDALSSIREQLPPGDLQKGVSEVICSMEEGVSFSEALCRYPNLFSTIVTGTVLAGEHSGALPELLLQLAERQSAQQRLRRKWMSTFLYPFLLLGACCFVGVFFSFWVLPHFENLFDEILPGRELPLFSRCIFAASRYVMIACPLLLILLLWLLRHSLKPKLGSGRGRSLLHILPGIGELFGLNTMGLFFSNLSMLIRAGNPLRTAFSVAMDSVAFPPFVSALDNAGASLSQGHKLSMVLEESRLLNAMELSLIENGEQSGRVEFAAEALAEQFRMQEEEMLQRFSTLLEPSLIFLLAAYIAVLVLAVVIPLSQAMQMML